MLAYVFWHWPAPGTDPGLYEERLTAFHHALDLPGSRTLRLDRAPYDAAPRAPAYEDWYPVADWAQLGELNERAVSGTRKTPHDAAAHQAGEGAGGVYKLLSGIPPHDAFDATWLTKPAGTAYADFIPTLHGPAVWQRQMVLGPAPEFVVQGVRDERGTQVRAEPI